MTLTHWIPVPPSHCIQIVKSFAILVLQFFFFLSPAVLFKAILSLHSLCYSLKAGFLNSSHPILSNTSLIAVVVVQLLSRVQLFVTPKAATQQVSLFLHYLLEFVSFESIMHPTISSCHTLLLLNSIFPSIRVFSNELSFHIRWPKYWSFSLYPQHFIKPPLIYLKCIYDSATSAV